MIIHKSHLAEKTALPVKEASHYSLLVSLVFRHLENIMWKLYKVVNSVVRLEMLCKLA